MNLHLDTRSETDFAFYIDGDLQFDTSDEALYHESLALPALSLAARAAPASGLRVLICGGGDGLALRECLRFPHVARVDLVDYSAEVVAWGRTRFADINRRAFDDPRAHVHIADAWEFLNARVSAMPYALAADKQARSPRSFPVPTTPPPLASAPDAGYHVVLCDFTVPRRAEDTRVYSVEWYALLSRALAPGGLLALNAFSPQTTPEAFWCLSQTVRAAGLSPQPYRVCIPSFRAQGYGTWAFLLAGPELRRRDLASLACPVSTQQVDMAALWQGAQFSRVERRQAQRVRLHSLDAPCLLPLLLNPGRRQADTAPRSDSSGTDSQNTPYDLDALLAAIPITHPYHTRVMIEALAEQVVGTLRHLDMQRLMDALLERAHALPHAIQTELARLNAYLQGRLPRLEWMGAWGRKLFVIIVLLMTLANAIAPDNAFGKGTSSFGHASISRGYSGGSFGAGGGSFGKGATHSASGSFGGSKPGYGSSFGSSGRTASGSFSGPAPSIKSTGFRSSYGSGRPTDIEGVAYPVRSYIYAPHWHGSGYGYGGTANGTQNGGASSGQEHKALFVADDDMLVLDNGDVVVTLSDTAYLLVSGATVNLMSNKSPVPLLALYPDPNLFRNIMTQLQDQQAQVEAGIGARRDWLSWVGWTSAFAGVIADDKTELHNLEDLDKRLQTALSQIKPPPDNAVPATPPETNPLELFVDSLLLQDGQIALRDENNSWVRTDGKKFVTAGGKELACPPEMKAVLRSVLVKLQQEFTGDLGSLNNNLKQLAQDKTSLDKDLADYNQIAAANSGDPSYEVDYGTDSIPVSDALLRTQSDLVTNQTDTTQTMAQLEKQNADLDRVEAALKRLGP